MISVIMNRFTPRFSDGNFSARVMKRFTDKTAKEAGNGGLNGSSASVNPEQQKGVRKIECDTR